MPRNYRDHERHLRAAAVETVAALDVDRRESALDAMLAEDEPLRRAADRRRARGLPR